VVAQLYALGETAGIGFQLHDDYLDVYAPADKFGKQVGGDILENKMTYLLIRCIEKADTAQKRDLDRLLYEETSPSAKISGVMALYEQLDIRAETLALMDRYFADADRLAASLLQQPGFEMIDAFFKSISKRDH
jgi:geranylgeranyl diphosphate synthase, type II